MLDFIPLGIVYYPYRDNNKMARLRGSKNKNSKVVTSSLSSQERIRLLANLIIDRMLEDQKSGQKLLKTIIQE